MSLDSLRKLVTESAPLLGSILGSPLASVGVSLLGNLFGADPKNIDEILDKATKDPEALAKLKKLEYDHLETLLKLSNEAYKIQMDDRANAREREKSLRDHVPTFLAVGFLFNYAAIQFYCVTHPSSAIDIISARFQDVLIMIISYYFGSSHREKPNLSSHNY